MGVQERKERERERRRQQIIVAAKRVFSEKGFSKTRMEDIANEAELAPATLYIYFKNKEELFASFSLTLLQCLCAKFKGIADDEGAMPEEKLTRLRNALYEVYLLDPWGLGSMLQVQSGEIFSNLSSDFMHQFKERFDLANAMLTAIFDDGIAQRVFVEKPSKAMVNIFWSTLSGVILVEKNRKTLQGEQDGFKDSFEFAFDIIQRGLTRTYSRKEVQDRVCCQCALKQDCSGLRELFKTPARGCAGLSAIAGIKSMAGFDKSMGMMRALP